ncbi:MAG: DNA topoisomerase IV subunit A, partial [Tetragenococcus halophilus]|nr:DNA topoisomerase IV subunit A [Tetragenococcus halophilus]
GTIYLIDHPNASLDKLMEFIPGPDFPTGGILQGKEEIKKAYETGKGKVILRSKTEIENLRGGKQQIVITEIPYEVNKATLVKKIDEIRLAKKIEGIAEVRDETDRTGLRMVIELKKDVNAQGVLNYLFKNTELQVNYSFNMVAIDSMRPQQVNLKHILESYVNHRRDIVLKRSQFELNKAQKRQHIVDGLMKALSILDQVIATIRASKDKKDAKNNLVIQHQFTQAQAEAIVNLQLYRLTNTDITELENEAEELAAYIAELQKILSDSTELMKVIKKELREVKKQFSNARLTQIEEEIEEIKIETEVLVPSEEVMTAITQEGYVKRSSLRSYNASRPEELGMKDSDEVVFCQQLNTLDHLLFVTNKGNMIYRPVFELPDLKWKETGEHLSQNLLNFSSDEVILAVYSYNELDPSKNFVFMTQKGMIKQTRMDEFSPWRTYKSRAMTAMKFKDDSDELVSVYLIDSKEELDVFLASYKGMGLRYSLTEVPVVGSKASGVKAMNLKAEDEVTSGMLVYSNGDNPVIIVSQRGAIKRMLAQELTQLSRAKRGVMILRELKKNPHRIIYMGDGQDKTLLLTNEKGQQVEIESNQYPISDRTSNGSFAIDEKQGGKVLEVKETFEYQSE